MSIRYPVMVFSFENVTAKRGVFIGAVALEDREIALPNIRYLVTDVGMRTFSVDQSTLYSDVYAKLAWAYLEQFSSETLREDFEQGVTLSSSLPWALRVKVVNSDVDYFRWCAEVHVELSLSPGNETPYMKENGFSENLTTDEGDDWKLRGLIGHDCKAEKDDDAD